MDVKWGALGQVAVVSLGATIGVVLVFALGVRAWSARDAARATGGGGTALTAAAGACFTACAAAVLYGIYLIVPQFH